MEYLSRLGGGVVDSVSDCKGVSKRGVWGGSGSGDSLAWWPVWGWGIEVVAGGGVEWMESVEEWVEGVLISWNLQRMQLLGW